MDQQASPIAAAERIQSIDIVRGVALLGIFIMNLPYFSASIFAAFAGTQPPQPFHDRAAEVIRDVLFAGKFNGMFSFLFAVGFTIQLERLSAQNRQAIYARRLLVLLAIGLIHGCIFWEGDVLHIYAALGLLLLLVRRASNRTVIAIFVASMFYSPILSLVRLWTVTPAEVQQLVVQAKARVVNNDLAFGHGSFLEAAHEHWRSFRLFYVRPWLYFELGFIVQLWATMMLGLLAARHRLFQTARDRLPLIRKAQWWSLAVGIVFGAAYGIAHGLIKNRSQPSVLGLVASTAFVWCRLCIMTFYVATLLRMAEHPTWQRRLRPIALAGRMPLTNYLLETLLASLVFYGWGLGLWGKLGPALLLALAMAIYFVTLVPFSALWMRHFQFGPMEYLWRALTYGRWPRLR
jgi:uncharacterized protein